MAEIVAQPEPFEADSLLCVWHHTRNSNIGIITAFRHDATPQANRADNGVLRAAIHGRFGYLKVRARLTVGDGSVEEESLLVIGAACNDSGNLLGFLRQEGRRFGQGRFVFKPYNDQYAYLQYTADAFSAGRKKHALGPWHPNKIATYHLSLFIDETFGGRDEHARRYADFAFYRPRGFFSRVETQF